MFYALFRVVEIEELSDAGAALEWARSMIDDPVLRRAFGDGVIEAVSKGAKGELGESST